ncbi:LysR family transcriptional regulator [Brevibacterium yomogidense]|uniref:LysR family transcriptional regulator n=1 Tax=Brevibacterium yomogidense TaxID=946573 RepID=UPI0018E036D8|nr:LysR family transcriptional regulator [Brevibacterium yomogidense]
MVDIHRLRILCSVVATGSLKATADALSFTPSAVSQHLSALQRETGLTLFERSGRGVVPTAHGRRLAEKGEEALAAVTRVDQFIDDLRIGRTGSLTIGTFASAGEHWLPSVAAQLRREFPTTTLVIELTDPPVSSVRPDIDIRTERRGAPPHAPAGVTRIVLARDPFVVILPRDHPYAGLREVAAADLGNDPWIHEFVGDGEAARIVEDIWRAAGIAPRSIIQAADHHGTIAFVAAGVGVSAMPALAATALPDSVVALPIVRPDAERIIVAHVRDSIRQQAAAERLLALLQDLGAAHHTPDP